MGMTLAEELELLLAEKCSGMCLDNEEERRKVAQTIADYLHQEEKDDRRDQRNER